MSGGEFTISEEANVDSAEERQRQALEFWSSRGSSAASYEDEHYNVPHPEGDARFAGMSTGRATVTAAGHDNIPTRAYGAWVCADCQRPPHGESRWRCNPCVPQRRRWPAAAGAGAGGGGAAGAAAAGAAERWRGGARRKSKRKHKRRKRNTRRRRRRSRRSRARGGRTRRRRRK